MGDTVLGILVGIFLLVILGIFALMINPPNAWVHRMTDKKRDE
jgi:hypothetical protein